MSARSATASPSRPLPSVAITPTRGPPERIRATPDRQGIPSARNSRATSAVVRVSRPDSSGCL